MVPLARKPSICFASNPSCRGSRRCASENPDPVRGNLGDALHLDRAADRGGHLAAAPFDRNDDLVRSQLRIVITSSGRARGRTRDMDGAEDLGPMSHGLRADTRRECPSAGPCRHQLRGSENRGSVRRIGPSDGFRHLGQLVRRHDEKVTRCRRLPEYTFRPHLRGSCDRAGPWNLAPLSAALDGNACGPDAFGEQRGGDVGSLAGAARGDRARSRSAE